MYALRDKEYPGGFGLLSYHRTIEEAQEAQSRHVKGTRERQEIPGVEWTEIVPVERDDRPCRYCGEQVESDNPDCDYCKTCFYTGRSQADAQEISLAMLREIPGAEDASVWHTGGGCFALGVTFPDGSYLLVSEEASITDENGDPLDPHAPVWHAGFYTDDEDCEGFSILDGPLDGDWPQATIPQIVVRVSQFLADPTRWDQLAQELERQAEQSEQSTAPFGAQAAASYRAEAARLRERA